MKVLSSSHLGREKVCLGFPHLKNDHKNTFIKIAIRVTACRRARDVVVVLYNIYIFEFKTMILDFTISNYRSINEPQTISFEATNDKHLEEHYVVKKGKYRILKLAMILGANASGKSNILRAFRMLHTLFLRPCAKKNDTIDYEKFALNLKAQQRDSEMTVNFICDNKKYCYDVIFNNQMVKYEKLQCHPFDKIRSHLVFERFTDKDNLTSKIKWGGLYSLSSTTIELSVNLLYNRTVFGAYQMSNVDIPWMKAIVEWLDEYMLPNVVTSNQDLFNYTSRMLNDDKKIISIVESMLRNADVGISKVDIREDTEEIPQELLSVILHDESVPEEVKKRIANDPVSHSLDVKLCHETSKGFAYLNYSQESNGTKRYYELAGVLLKLVEEPHFVAIDELECRLHPDLYKHFVTSFLLNSKESQLVFTTHLREFLGETDGYRKDSVWFTEKNDDGETELYSLADFAEKNLMKMNALDLYKAGRFGGIPNLGDIYLK